MQNKPKPRIAFKKDRSGFLNWRFEQAATLAEVRAAYVEKRRRVLQQRFLTHPNYADIRTPSKKEKLQAKTKLSKS